MADEYMVRELSLQWLKLEPERERTKAKLRGIVEHFAPVYGVSLDRVNDLTSQAWEGVPLWMRREEG